MKINPTINRLMTRASVFMVLILATSLRFTGWCAAGGLWRGWAAAPALAYM